MIFRSRRSSSGAVSPRQSPTYAATVNNFSPAASAGGFERPSSAPVAGLVPQQPGGGGAGSSMGSPTTTASAKPDDAHSVEDRLSIVKRSRTASSSAGAGKPHTTRESAGAAPALLSPDSSPIVTAGLSPVESSDWAAVALPNTGVKPPCSAYPTFSTAKLPKHEQHVMDALMREFTEVLFFAKSESQ